MKKVGIYKITNLLNGKIYIGKSVDIYERFNTHKRESLISQEQWEQNYRGIKTPFHAAIRKYGAENFKLEIIEECLEQELNEKEKYYIKLYNSTNKDIGYNIQEGGTGGWGGKGEGVHNHILTQKEVDLIKQKLKERWTSKQIQELIPKASSSTISNINYGISWYDENETYPISINNGHRKWSDSEALAIKNEYANGATIIELCEKYQVNRSTISDLISGRSYTNLPIIERKVDYKKIATNRKLTQEEVESFRKEYYIDKKSILSIYNNSGLKCSYSAFYNMIKGLTYKNYGGL